MASRRYAIRKIYVVICSTCNEDITRTLSGDEPETRRAAEECAADHEETFHTGTRY